VTSVFQTTDQGGDSDNANEVMTDRLNTMHLIQGKEKMTPEEQKFDGLFWDNIEMKTPHQPGGVYQAYKQKMGTP